MRDQFERNINYMRVSVTDLCNLRCVYCMPKEGIRQISHDEILTFDEIARVCRIGAELGISRIKLTGGEPLVRKGIEDLAEMICRIPGIEQVTLTTNGILLKDKLPALKNVFRRQMLPFMFCQGLQNRKSLSGHFPAFFSELFLEHPLYFFLFYCHPPRPLR